MRAEPTISLAASLLLLWAGVPLARADTHDLDGNYEYITVGSSGSDLVTFRMKIGDGKIEFRNPSDEHDRFNRTVPAAIENGAAPEFSAAIGAGPFPNLDFYRTRMDLRGNGHLVDVTIVKKVDSNGDTISLHFYIVYNNKPYPIISNAVPSRAN